MKIWVPLGLIVFLLVACFAAPLVEQATGLSAQAVSLENRYEAPSARHWMGTDGLGRDVLLRILQGGQVSLTVGLAAALAAAFLGTAIGTAAGYLGGRWDAFLMRAADMLIALPTLPLLIVLSAIDMGKLGLGEAALSPQASLYKITLLIALLGWTTVARLARARTLSLKNMDFVLSARALGVGHARIVCRHILPNAMGTIIVATSLAVGHVVLVESVLSFLGLGIQPPVPSWGNMLTGAEETMWDHARLMVYPGVMIFVTVLSFNFLGDALSDWLDPRARRQVRARG